jgi:hypothetical protein
MCGPDNKFKISWFSYIMSTKRIERIFEEQETFIK